MKRLSAVLCLGVLLAGCRPEEAEPVGAEQMALEGLEDDTEATQASLDASESAIEGPASAFGDAPGCSATVAGTDVISVCSREIPATRTVSWSCAGAGGNSVTGTATVVTTILDDTACPSVQVRHDVTFARTRAAGDVSAALEGTSQVTFTLDALNRTARRDVTLDVTRRVHRDASLVRDQRLTGERRADLAANAEGPEDDTRTVNGNATVEFLLRGAQLDVGATDLLWRCACCHPVGGRIDWILDGPDHDRAGSIEFGPACGQAVRENGGDVELRACPLFD